MNRMDRILLDAVEHADPVTIRQALEAKSNPHALDEDGRNVYFRMVESAHFHDALASLSAEQQPQENSIQLLNMTGRLMDIPPSGWVETHAFVNALIEAEGQLKARETMWNIACAQPGSAFCERAKEALEGPYFALTFMVNRLRSGHAWREVSQQLTASDRTQINEAIALAKQEGEHQGREAAERLMDNRPDATSIPHTHLMDIELRLSQRTRFHDALEARRPLSQANSRSMSIS